MSQDSETARRRRHGGDVVVALVGVDAFKHINDDHAHHAGDEVLMTPARRRAAA